MSFTSAVTIVRRSTKRIVAQPRFHWLAGPARRIWYYLRMTGELANVPAVLSGFDQSVRARPPAELVDYVFNRFQGMFRPFQNRNELQRFIERASTLGARTVVEIGTARGGTLFLLSCCADPAARIVSVDLPAGPFGGGYPSWKGHLYRRIVGRGQKLHLVRGNSHKESTFNEAVQALNGAAVDILFIDGDHSYAGAKQDFLRYRSLVRPGGLVIFHDILENVLDKDITVAPLWREIKQSFETEEIVDSYDQGRFGIGVVTAPADWEAPVALA